MLTPLRRRVLLSVLAMLFLLSVACSDDDGPGPVTGPDETPPGVASITPVDEYHIDVKFTEPVTTESAENTDNYVITEAVPLLLEAADAYLPGDTLTFSSAILNPDRSTLTITTDGSMAGSSYSLNVIDVVDLSGNTMTSASVKRFIGSLDPDQTPPTIVSRSPAPGATGVPVGPTVTVRFLEPVTYATFAGASSLFPAAGGGAVECRPARTGSTSFTLTPRVPLEPGTMYTVSVNASDPQGNTMTTVQWSFTTTNTVDTTPATIVSTFPPNLATDVDVFTTFSVIFSEAIEEDEVAIEIVPDPGVINSTLSTSGQTITYQFSGSLLEDQQYLVTLYATPLSDFSGNELDDLYTFTFTTASALPQGSISGTIAGDAGTAAADPAGAVVIAASGPPLFGNVAVLGSGVVDANGAYTISNLADGEYFPILFMDTTGDGFLLGTGDAAGGYGMDLAVGDTDADSVVIDGGTQATGVDFAVLDPSGIRGTLAYSGVYVGDLLDAYVGIFDTEGFDPTSTPLAVRDLVWPVQIIWSFTSLLGIPDGDYYVAAFLDVDGSGTYEPGIDPGGAYGGWASPNVVHIENGSDIFGILIPIDDPAIPGISTSVAWPREKHTGLERLLDAVQKSGVVAKK